MILPRRESSVPAARVTISDLMPPLTLNGRLTHTEYEYTPISPWRQKRYFAVTAADRFGNESAPLELNAISETDMPLLNDGDILTLPEIKEAKTVKIFTATGEEIKYFVYAPQMSIASLPGGFYTVYILNNAGAQTFVGTIVK